MFAFSPYFNLGAKDHFNPSYGIPEDGQLIFHVGWRLPPESFDRVLDLIDDLPDLSDPLLWSPLLQRRGLLPHSLLLAADVGPRHGLSFDR